MDPDDIYPWCPQGVEAHQVFAAGANHYIARYDDNTVLKFPLVPQKDDSTPIRSGIRAAAVQSLNVEAQILSRLGNHPRIVQLKGVHEDGILLEYLPNGSVGSYLQDHPYVSMRQRLGWSRQAAEGLAYVHAKDVLHCDLSVGNLLLDAGLSVKICDFQGRLFDAHGNTVLDSWAAASAKSSMPRSDPRHMDRWTDIFALGTALFFIITSALPFPDLQTVDEVAILERYARHEFSPLDDVPAGDVIRRCWTGSYQSTSEVVADLREWEDAVGQT